MTAEEFKTLFLPCHQRLYRLAYRQTGSQQEAEDLVQETFLRLWSRRKELTDIENAEAFSLMTLKNLWLDSIRRKKLDSADKPPEDYILADETDIAHDIEIHDTTEKVICLIKQLPEQQRQIMMMKDVSDLSFEEIGESTGLSQGNIRTLLSRARKKIREQYYRLSNHEQY